MFFAHAHGLIWLALTACCLCAIDRLHIVSQYDLRRGDQDSQVPFQVGNGNFAFNVDITGTQSIRPFKTLSTWGQHQSLSSSRTRRPAELDDADNQGSTLDTMRLMNLARIGLLWNGAELNESMLEGPQQVLRLTTGIIASTFSVGIEPVDVETLASPSLDAIALRVQSEALKNGNLSVYIDFPGPSINNDPLEEKSSNRGWTHAHKTSFQAWGPRVEVKHEIENSTYFVNVQWETGSPTSRFFRLSPDTHRYMFDVEEASAAEFVLRFTPDSSAFTPSFASVKKESAYWWRQFWTRGAFFDCTATRDPRADALQRLAILSQYHLAVNAAGSTLATDSGLFDTADNGVTGQDLAWSYLAHWQRWNKWDRLGGLLPAVYRKIASNIALPNSGLRRHRSRVTTDSTLWHIVDPFYFAEQEYQAIPTQETLGKWQNVLEQTARDMINSARFNHTTQRYSISRPSAAAELPNDYIFDIAYWRFGLSIMIKWFERQELSVPKAVKQVYDGLTHFPINQVAGTYMSSPSSTKTSSLISSMLGMLPPDPQLNMTVFNRTMDEIYHRWLNNSDLVSDLPMLAMNAVRSENSSRAVDILLDKHLASDDSGLPIAWRSGQAHFSTSGGLLTTIAMLASGWANATGPHWPPSWDCIAEGFNPGL